MIAAASAGHLDMVKFLIDSNADVNAKDKVRRARGEIRGDERGPWVAWHLEGVELTLVVPSRWTNSRTGRHHGADGGQHHGAQGHRPAPHQGPHLAATLLFARLLCHGSLAQQQRTQFLSAEYDRARLTRVTSLHFSCLSREQKKADVNAQAASQVTALWLAAGEGRHDIVQVLIAEVRRRPGEVWRGECQAACK